MKLGVISDVHGNFEALKVVLAELKKDGVERIISLGDQIGYGVYGNEVLDLIKENINVEAIRGNHEETFINNLPCRHYNLVARESFEMLKSTISEKNKKYLSSLKKRIIIDIDGVNVCCIHGMPGKEMEGYCYPYTLEEDIDLKNYEGFDYIFMGHTHVPMRRTIYTKHKVIVLINPGSVGQPRDFDPRASYIVFDTETKEIFFKRVKVKE